MSVITHSLIHSLGLARDVQRSRPVQHTIIIIIIISSSASVDNAHTHHQFIIIIINIIGLRRQSSVKWMVSRRRRNCLRIR